MFDDLVASAAPVLLFCSAVLAILALMTMIGDAIATYYKAKRLNRPIEATIEWPHYEQSGRASAPHQPGDRGAGQRREAGEEGS